MHLANTVALRHAFLFGLAPGGVFPATPVTKRAVRSYRPISPLPWQAMAVYFLWHFPSMQPLSAAPAGRYPAPCLHGARTFLQPLKTSDHPIT